MIEFGTNQFEHALWKVIQTRPFQRLRRIKQLGFSELVYPGATHTRFAHSVGVFHVARQLAFVIEKRLTGQGQFQDHQAKVAVAAALVHDVGHGMFSHSFEEVGKALKIKMAHHENVSDALIRDDEITAALSPLGKGFASEVADLIKQGAPKNLYDAVVSSQFDADRLDYMQRDRMMAGVHSSGIDFTWLISNLEIGTLNVGVDDEEVGKVETFVLGPKAYLAAESFVLSLFQLYPNVYFHKTTRGAEKVFSALMLRLIELVRDGSTERTGLAINHPIVRFAKEPELLAHVIALDDAVFNGALPMLVEASDEAVAMLASQLWNRRLPKCCDIRERILADIGLPRQASGDGRKEFDQRLQRIEARIEERLADWSRQNSKETPRLLIDRAERDPYKRSQESKGPLNQIHIRASSGKILDMAETSAVVAGLEKFK
ncbi:MAG TPA: HD domain-containing protein, partial [Rhizomicrobium sp.]|nr:HD domain-containing protein [Rhizomicrobium sp.]